MADPAIRPGAEPFSLGGGPLGLLMVHGFTGSPASMRPIGEWLARHGVAVEGVRLPGHGTNLDDLRSRRWTEWTDETSDRLDVLLERSRTVVAFGQSMGASVVLYLAAHRDDVDGLALSNPYVFDARHAMVPAGSLFLRTVAGVANDIAKPGQDENADGRMPVPGIVQMAAMMRRVRAALPSIAQPVIVFRSGADHVIPRTNPVKVLERIGSRRKELVDCPRSYHVLTLDHDAPVVRERLLAFAAELDDPKGSA